MNTLLAQQTQPMLKGESGYTFQGFENDPLKTRIYTLSNGLKVYLSINKNEPRVYCNIAVKAGSKYDPAETTGLAHYLEHMMFKGTNKIATKNWEDEKVLLNQIADLYELHRKTDNDKEKKNIYQKIDSISYKAAQYAIPNEYDKMISTLGAKGTNAYTSNERTVYINDIPSNELDKFLKIEAERFKTLVLRLFHTELETVYEEFNRSEDNDYRKSWKSINEGLYPNHPFGKQTTIGEGEHLKNPSMYNIHQYFNTYYRPNNCAIVLVGDLDYDKTIALVDEHFGDWKAAEIPQFTYAEEPPIEEPKLFNNYGSQAEHLYIGWRFDGAQSKQTILMQLAMGILQNGQAGLFDLNLTKQQKVLQLNAFDIVYHDYSSLVVYAVPRQGQSLNDLNELILKEVEKLSTGNFEEWLLPAIINDYEFKQLKQFEANRNRAAFLVDQFVWEVDYNQLINSLQQMQKITKADIMDFAQKHLNSNNYVAAFKHVGEDPNIHKVDKPAITAVPINRNEKSDFFEEFEQISSMRLTPEFLDFKNDIQHEKLGDIPLYKIHNNNNASFALYYIFEMGKNHNKDLPLAFNYLPFLGTEKYSAEEISKTFFKLGVELKVSSSKEKSYVYIKGLKHSFNEGLALLEHLLAGVKADSNAYVNLVDGILKHRNDNKLNKDFLLRQGLVSYAKYGAKSPLTDIIDSEELEKKDLEILINLIHNLKKHPHKVFYYGNLPIELLKNEMTPYYNEEVSESLPQPVIYPELETSKNQVYFTHYDQKQVELMLIAKGQPFNKNVVPYIQIFNEYFGAGLSSIVFQEIREAKALAYSAYAYQNIPDNANQSHYTMGYIGTQTDKLQEAIDAMLGLLNNMPKANDQFEAAKLAALKRIESDRITKANVFWTWERNKKRGIDYDYRADLYEAIQKMSFEDLEGFFNTYIKAQEYTFLVIGDKTKLEFDVLNQLGEVTELNLEQICGY